MTACTAHTGPVWKCDGEECGCTLPAGHPPATHECSCGALWDNSIRRS